jgi:hypothetical protein
MQRWLWLWLLCACTQSTNPCPYGSEPVRDENRCELPSSSETGASEGDAGMDEPDARPSEHRHDGGHPKPPVIDGSTGEGDAGMDGGSVPPDTGTPDSGPPTNVPACSVDDQKLWGDFHAADDLVQTLQGCQLSLCKPESCPAADCVRRKLHVETCGTCVNDEATCAVRLCGSACKNGDDAECHACVCEAGCTAAFSACAGRPFDVCTNVFGRDSNPTERKYQKPLLYRIKKTTGFIKSYPALAKTPAQPFEQQWSSGFTDLVSLFIAGEPYLLQHKNSEDPRLVRISPVLSSGELGRPGYLENWSQGWDELEAFEASGQSYLLRYKTGVAGGTNEEPEGRLRIDRITRAADTLALKITKVYEATETPPAQQPWSAIETFALSGTTYVLFYGTDRNGAVKIARVDVAGDALSLTSVSDEHLSWSRDWDVVETVHLGASWYVLTYKSGLHDANLSLAAGSVQVLAFSASAGRLSVSAPVYQGNWGRGLSHVVGFSFLGHDYLLRQGIETNYTQLLQVADSSDWATKLGDDVFSPAEMWGANPGWDVLEIVRQLPW